MKRNKAKTGRCQELASRHTKTNGVQRKRILVLDNDKAKPNSAAWNFLKRQIGKCGRSCIEIVPRPDAIEGQMMIRISEDACPVCLTRAKQCPGGAVKVVNLPSNLTTDTTHRYGPNSFKLHGLPEPRPAHVVGLLGCNGIGKTTALNILSGDLKPNLGLLADISDPPTWEEIIRYYRGSDLQNYFKRMMDGKLRCVSKPQLEPASVMKEFAGKKVGVALEECNERGNLEELIKKLELSHLLDRQVQTLSGGELQRFMVCICANRDADVYLFDEPSSFLDVKQRLAVADVIRDLVDVGTYRMQKHGQNKAEALQIASSKYVVVVEHDLTILDYMCDYVCCLYGEPAVYGIVTQRSTAANGINQFIAGYFNGENIRFRAESLSFHVSPQEMDALPCDSKQRVGEHRYPAMSKSYGSESSAFALRAEAGDFRDGEVIGLLAQNGCGKTTFLEMIARYYSEPAQSAGVKPQHGSTIQKLSFKRQHAAQYLRRFKGTVDQFLEKHIQWGLANRMFRLLVMKPLMIDNLKDLAVRLLSGGEMQRLAICVCLGMPAGLYLIDEPSAGLDCEQRLVVAKVIKRWVVSHCQKTAFVIEHDMVMASALYDRVIVFDGVPGVECTASRPLAPLEGLNTFLGQLNVTFYHSPNSNRPRINKRGSRRDREQKASGNYFAVQTITTTSPGNDG